jgi:hypothetical protein
MAGMILMALLVVAMTAWACGREPKLIEAKIGSPSEPFERAHWGIKSTSGWISF